MIHMLCRNRVADFEKWRAVFDSHAEAHRAAGLRLVHLWRGVDDPNNVFFMFAVESLDQARRFIDAPESADAGQESGVIEGDYHFLETSQSQ